MLGKIVKGIAGFYYVHVVESGVYECKAKGIFRKEKIKPLVGDNVEMDVIDEKEKTGNIVRICSEKERAHPSRGSQYRSGAHRVCGDKAKAASESTGPVSDHDGEQRHSGNTLLQ